MNKLNNLLSPSHWQDQSCTEKKLSWEITIIRLEHRLQPVLHLRFKTLIKVSVISIKLTQSARWPLARSFVGQYFQFGWRRFGESFLFGWMFWCPSFELWEREWRTAAWCRYNSKDDLMILLSQISPWILFCAEVDAGVLVWLFSCPVGVTCSDHNEAWQSDEWEYAGMIHV